MAHGGSHQAADVHAGAATEKNAGLVEEVNRPVRAERTIDFRAAAGGVDSVHGDIGSRIIENHAPFGTNVEYIILDGSTHTRGPDGHGLPQDINIR